VAKRKVAGMLIERGANVKLDVVIAPKQDRADLIHMEVIVVKTQVMYMFCMYVLRGLSAVMIHLGGEKAVVV